MTFEFWMPLDDLLDHVIDRTDHQRLATTGG
jgi:hypothetical protein